METDLISVVTLYLYMTYLLTVTHSCYQKLHFVLYILCVCMLFKKNYMNSFFHPTVSSHFQNDYGSEWAVSACMIMKLCTMIRRNSKKLVSIKHTLQSRKYTCDPWCAVIKGLVPYPCPGCWRGKGCYDWMNDSDWLSMFLICICWTENIL